MADEKKNWILGDKFDQVMPHHAGIKALWETKWRFPVSLRLRADSEALRLGIVSNGIIQCTLSVYPFHDGKFVDFEPVFQYLIEVPALLLALACLPLCHTE
jgi:hypothetical protein